MQSKLASVASVVDLTCLLIVNTTISDIIILVAEVCLACDFRLLRSGNNKQQMNKDKRQIAMCGARLVDAYAHRSKHVGLDREEEGT